MLMDEAHWVKVEHPGGFERPGHGLDVVLETLEAALEYSYGPKRPMLTSELSITRCKFRFSDLGLGPEDLQLDIT